MNTQILGCVHPDDTPASAHSARLSPRTPREPGSAISEGRESWVLVLRVPSASARPPGTDRAPSETPITQCEPRTVSASLSPGGLVCHTLHPWIKWLLRWTWSGGSAHTAVHKTDRQPCVQEKWEKRQNSGSTRAQTGVPTKMHVKRGRQPREAQRSADTQNKTTRMSRHGGPSLLPLNSSRLLPRGRGRGLHSLTTASGPGSVFVTTPGYPQSSGFGARGRFHVRKRGQAEVRARTGPSFPEPVTAERSPSPEIHSSRLEILTRLHSVGGLSDHVASLLIW